MTHLAGAAGVCHITTVSAGSENAIPALSIDGKTTPTDSYAASIAVVVSLMLVTLLLAAGMLSVERSEHAYSRIVRGLVSPGRLAPVGRRRFASQGPHAHRRLTACGVKLWA